MKAEITALGEDALYNDIEFPLAQVLADMTRIGILVDREGIEKFGVKMRAELEDVLTRIHMETGLKLPKKRKLGNRTAIHFHKSSI